MKIKTIEKIINGKFDNWLKSIKDETVKKLVEKNTVLAGGSICSLLLNGEVNDFDFYFTNIETTEAVANYYVNLYKENNGGIKHKNGMSIDISVVRLGDRVKIVIKSAGVASNSSPDTYEYFEGDRDGQSTTDYVTNVSSALSSDKKETGYSPIFLSSNAITLSNDVQLIVRFYGNPTQILDNYDFVHCTNYWDSATKRVTTNKDALECILTKELRYIGSKYPIASMFRLRKFIRREWNITAGQILKIAMQVSELNLKDINVLEEQLIGVDVAYFQEIISKLKDKNSESIDKTYLIQLIEEMF